MTRSLTATKPWTSGEEKELGAMLEAGKSVNEIAEQLERTPYAVYARLKRLYRKRPIRDIAKNCSSS